ncbi:hypothetical protein FRC06_010515 [Ceratobasidium sp. 370]|nr:hypothetical protein FRC06_010515 [Ceratobasidium sp. 370]
MLEDVLTALDSELPNLTPSLELAANANNIVKVLRNRSTTLVPINLLPSELLERIFELLSHSRTNTGVMDNIPAYPEALLRVCTSWQQRALDNRQLWRRIILVLPSIHEVRLRKRAEARLERAHESLLDFHVHGGSSWGLDSRMKELLARVAPQLGSICWQAHRHFDPSFLKYSLPVLIELGTLGTVYSLRLRGSTTYPFVTDPATFPSMERVEAFLAPIKYLDLHNVFIDWTSKAYHSLVELELSFEGSVQFPTADEFAAILLASPRLRALKLHDFGLQPRSSPSATRPVRLDDLEVLFLGNARRGSLKQLLPLIPPGSRPLYMRFRLPNRGTYFTHYAQLLRRSYVAKLMVEGIGGYPSQALLASLANVQDLLLVNFCIDNLFLQSMAEPLIHYAKEQHPSVWPHLRSLHLAKCTFRDTKFYDDFATPILYDFRLWIWDIKEFHGKDDLPLNPTSSEGQRLLGLLASYIPGMQDIRPDQTLMSCAWGSALAFSDLNC